MKTKITLLFLLTIILSLGLAGCSEKALTTTTVSGGLSTATRLAAGSLKLQGTSNVITSTEASQLLTLWEAYQTMGNSDTTSQVEMEALVKQIQGAMTSEQLTAIDDMGLTEQAISELLQSVAPDGWTNSVASAASSSNETLTSGAPAAPSVSSSSSQGGSSSGPSGAPPNGSMAGGSNGSAGGDSVMSAINDSGTSTQSIPAATQSTNNTASSQVSPLLIQAVIQMLKSASQASG